MATFCSLLYRKLIDPDTNSTVPLSYPRSLCQIIKTLCYLLYLFISLLLHVGIVFIPLLVHCYLNDTHFVKAIS